MNYFLILLILFSLSPTWAFVNKTTVPTNPCVGLNDYGEPCISELEYRVIAGEVLKEFSPDFVKVGWNLLTQLDWSNPKENATYNLINKNTLALVIYGGAARASDVTRVGLAIIVCHELGHAFGSITKTGNSAVYGFEGEADYFAANICVPRIISKIKSISKVQIPNHVKKICSLSSYMDTELCIRLNQGSLAASRMRARILSQKEPSFLTPDPTQVQQSNPDLTSAQCGLDTFFTASINKNRPRCWYRP